MRSTQSLHREQVAKSQGSSTATAMAAHAHDDHGMAHVVSPFVLLAVFTTLMILTIVTVAVTSVDFGYNLNLIVALSIAVVKATLVILYFMHLRYDSIFYSVIIAGCLAFVALFIVFTIIDTGQNHDILNPVTVTPAS